MEVTYGDDDVPAGLRPDVRRWARRAAIALALVGALWLALTHVPASLSSFFRGETDLSGHRVYTPPHGVRKDALDSMDLTRVHRELLPRWVVAEADGATETARTTFTELRREAGKDPNLGALLDSMSEALRSPRSRERGARFSYLVWAWSTYLDRGGVPFRVVATVRSTAKRQIVYVKTYRTLAATTSDVGGQAVRARLVAREDRLNVVEGYLGHTSSRDEGAVVLADRTREVALQQIWPMLHEGADGERSPVDAAFAPAVRAEAMRALSPAAFAVLHATALDRGALLRTADAIATRGKKCGTTFRLWSLPIEGLSRSTLQEIESLRRADAEYCAEVTVEEADVLRDASSRLATTEALPGAVDALTAWVARAVTVHELRHAADLRPGSDEVAPPCPRCDRRLGPTARAELSAYLAGAANGEIAALSLYQACAGAQAEAPAGAAVLALVPAVLPDGCEGGPPPDARARAETTERSLFNRSDAITLSPEFPERVAGAPRD
jgi:hypothetical protein